MKEQKRSLWSSGSSIRNPAAKFDGLSQTEVSPASAPWGCLAAAPALVLLLLLLSSHFTCVPATLRLFNELDWLLDQDCDSAGPGSSANCPIPVSLCAVPLPKKRCREKIDCDWYQTSESI
jgi:hypothetical protein